MTQKGKIECILDSSRSIYLPQQFATLYRTTTKGTWSGVSEEDILALEHGPDDEFYYEAWDSVLANAIFTDDEGDWHLHQDSDLFLVHEDYELEDELA